MTYPTSPNDALDAGGAFEIGGGDFNFGQDYTESLIKNLFAVPAPTILGAIDALRDALLKLPLEALQLFKDLLPDVIEGAFDTVTGAVDAIIGALTHNPVWKWIQDIIDAIVNALFGWLGEGFGILDGQNALARTAETITKISQAVAELKAAAAPGMISVTDDFERSGSSLGSNWDELYGSGNGSYKPDGSNLRWYSAYPNGNREFIARWIGATGITSASDYQRVSVVLATSAEKSLIGEAGHNDAWARLSSDMQNGIRFRVGGDSSCSISRFVGGSRTDLVTGTCSRPGPGGVITLEAGEKSTSTLRKFKGLVDGVTVLEYTEASTTSMVGSGYRHWGLGARAEGVAFASGQINPGRTAQWFGQDQ